MATTLPKPLKERERLAALASYRILDTAPEQSYDDITAVAAQICGTPIALVSLVDPDRQWFKSRVGLDARETARNIAFCDHTIRGDDVMVVRDARQDERFRHSPLVLEEPHVRFYAGAPLVDSEGHNLGALCVIDRNPRQLSDQQLAALEALARMVIDQLTQRRTTRKLAEALERVHLLDKLVPVCSYCKKIREDNEFWQDLDTYLRQESGADLTHGVCPECLEVELAKAEN